MNEFAFENQGTSTYLVYEISPEDDIDSMSLGMLTNNSIPGFAPAVFTQMDTAKYIKYNVSAKVSAKQLFSGPVNKKRLIGVFSGVVDAMLSAEDYMLDPQTILLDLNYIFVDVSTCETELVCLPVMNFQHENSDLPMFFKNILFTTQFDQTENCDHVAQILNYLNGAPTLSLVDFKKLLDSIEQDQGPAAIQSKRPEMPRQTAQQPQAQPQAAPIPPASVRPPVSSVAAAPRQDHRVTPPPAPQMPTRQPVPTQAPAAQPNQKPMSFFYLMQHYNKDNAAAYKAQQEAKKSKVPAGPTQVPPKAQKPKAPTKKAQVNFAVPGQAAPVNPGFAVPGQRTAPAPAPAPVPMPAKKEQPKHVPQGDAAGKCRQCGAVMKPGQAFCSRCGARNLAAAGSPQSVQQPIAQQPVQQPIAQQPVQQPIAQPVGPVNFGETTVLGGRMGETTVLGGATEAAKTDPHLIRAKNNEKIPLNKPVFRIGKERSYVDYFVADNTAVSRSHANIINHNGEFFVVDTNSTNHTYVNGGMIQSNTEVKLSHGTKLRLANEEFEFRLF